MARRPYPWPGGGPPRKPRADRFLVTVRVETLVVTLALFTHLAAAAETWTLDAAVQKALASAGFDELSRASAARERAEGAATLPMNNPFLGYQREQSFGLGWTGTAEDYLWLGQTVDLSFRQGLYEEAGERRAEAALLVVEDRRRTIAARIAQHYVTTLAFTERVAARQRWTERLTALADTLRAREQAGDASRYDVLRIERELALAGQRLDDDRISLSRTRSELAAWLADDPDAMILVGPLPPDAPSSGAAVPRPPAALALDEEVRALSLEEQAAGRWYLPPVTVTAGGKTVFAPNVAEVGYLVTAQFPLPVFERNQDRRAALAAARRVRSAEAELLAMEVERAAAAAVVEWTSALRALRAHLERSAERSEALRATAQAAWSGGELSLLALLEAERALIDDDLSGIDLALRARLAQLEHAALTREAAP